MISNSDRLYPEAELYEALIVVDPDFNKQTDYPKEVVMKDDMFNFPNCIQCFHVILEVFLK